MHILISLFYFSWHSMEPYGIKNGIDMLRQSFKASELEFV